jgi:hypothetical protein
MKPGRDIVLIILAFCRGLFSRLGVHPAAAIRVGINEGPTTQDFIGRIETKHPETLQPLRADAGICFYIFDEPSDNQRRKSKPE